MKIWQPASVLAVLFFPATLFAADNSLPNMQEGLWEITTKFEISGMSKNLPAHTVQHCVTKKDIEQGHGNIHQPDSRNKNCQVTDYKVRGNKASWRLVCTGTNPMTGNGSVTYNGDSFAGGTRMKMGSKGRETEMTQTFSGKRIGECKK